VVDKQAGFFWTVVCYSIAAVILFLITFATTRERVQPAHREASSFRSDLSDLLANRPWMVLLAVGLFQILSDWTRGSAIAYYFTYYVDSEFGDFLVAGTTAGIVGMLATRPLVALFGKKLLLIAMNLGKAGLVACFYLLERDDVSQKLGGALGAAVPGWALAIYGFRPPVDGVMQVQDPAAIGGIVLMMSLIPAVFLLGAVTVLVFYGIDRQLIERVERDLADRHRAVDLQQES